jgi:hypothetical protein
LTRQIEQFGAPQVITTKGLSARPIRHYVGWTQQVKPSKRISRHGPAANREVVYLEPGTTRDEQMLKLTGTCPKCGEAYSGSLA